MAARTLGLLAGIGLFASTSAYADPPGGDIVDQILHPTPQPGAAAAPTVPGPIAPAPIASAPVPAASPSGAATARPLAPFTVSTVDSPDVASRPAAPQPAPVAMPQTAPAPLIPPPATATAPPPDLVGQPGPSLPAPLPVASRWQGFYAGVNGGSGSTSGGTGSSCINSVTNTTSGCIVLGNSGLDTHGILGGGQIGYMTPVDLGGGFPLLMVGVETDLEGSGISGSQNISPPLPLVNFPPCTNCFYTSSQGINWLGSTRLRVGLPIDDLMFYATGGVVYGGVHAAQNIFFTGQRGNYGADVKPTLTGPAVGGGAEYQMAGPMSVPVSVRLEALYYDLGSVRSVAEPMNGAAINFSDTRTFGFRGALIRLGVNVRLGDLMY